MTTPIELSVEQARRIAVRAQWLDDADRGDDLAALTAQLTHLPVNVTEIVLPSAEHIAFTRLGEAITPDSVREAAEVELTLFEHLDQPSPIDPVAVMLRAASDLPLLRADMDAWSATHPRTAAWVEANRSYRDEVLELLRLDGPLPQSEIPDHAQVSYQSSGWNTARNVAMMLEALQGMGEVVVTERRGSARVWDLASRLLPEVDAVPADLAHAEWERRRLRAWGIARPKQVGDAGVPARIEGLRGEWRLDPDASAEGFVSRTVLLSPLDRLILHKPRMRDLWDFEYANEQYTPAAKRRWGTFALPILDGADLVGKVDSRTDFDTGRYLVHAVHYDTEATIALRSRVDEQLERFADWLGLRLVR